jgi:ABC-type bacteriocin/lantibiotic exporter with double-glycine peptidase domain
MATQVPVRLALGANESGIAALAMVMASRGVRVGQEELLRVCGVTRDGSSFTELADTAAVYHLEPMILSGDASLLDDCPLPAIIHWGASHSRVVESKSGSSWSIIDPFLGRLSISDAELRANWGGEALVVPATSPPDRVRSWERLRTRMRGSWTGVWFVVLAGLGLVVPGLVAPALIREFVDEYLIAGDRQGAVVLIGGLVAALIVSLVLLLLQLRGLQRLLTVSLIRNASRFVWHLLRMPAWFFSQRDATTLAYRVGLNEQLADVLAGRFTAALLAQLTSLFFLILMIFYSPLLAAVAVIGPVLAAILMWRIALLRSEIRQRQAREGSVTATELGVTLRMIETLKATGSEDVAFNRAFSSVGRRLTLGYTGLWGYIGMVPVFASALTSAFVLIVGAYLVMQGSLTQGTLAGFTILLGGFLSPLVILVPSLDSVLNLRGAWEQMTDVLEQHVDPGLWDEDVDGPMVASMDPNPTGGSEFPSDPGMQPLLGSDAQVSTAAGPVSPTGALEESSDEEDQVDPIALIAASGRRRRGRLSVDPWAAALTMREVTFGYSPRQPPLLDRVSLQADPGRIIAVVGSSGGGKSTLGRLVGGLYRPWSGQVLIDGRPLDAYPREARAREVTFVNQDVVLYSASVRDNITMFDPLLRDRDIISAARDACVHEDIALRPGGYDSVLQEDGKDLSGGQRQRIVIARALVRRPRLLVLDEATSALDARTEAQVMDNLRGRGCTVLVVAHRLSTVRDADEIIVIDAGQIVERGTHQGLSGSNGLYRELMTS